MIQSFKDKRTQSIFDGHSVNNLPYDIQQRARLKLRMLDAATSLEDLLIPPSNRLERLRGKRLGQYSIRINKQWRLCFGWQKGNTTQVHIVDYH
jgi:proteic killer suppression protein